MTFDVAKTSLGYEIFASHWVKRKHKNSCHAIVTALIDRAVAIRSGQPLPIKFREQSASYSTKPRKDTN